MARTVRGSTCACRPPVQGGSWLRWGELFGARSLAEFARDEGNDILDLMDLCDREGIPYDFGFIDSNEDAALRRADL